MLAVTNMKVVQDVEIFGILCQYTGCLCQYAGCLCQYTGCFRRNLP